MIVAWAAGIGGISAAANASKQEPIEMRGSDSMFASLAEELGTGVWFQAAEATLKPFRFEGQRVRVGPLCIFW
jgi:hypothetical protein